MIVEIGAHDEIVNMRNRENYNREMLLDFAGIFTSQGYKIRELEFEVEHLRSKDQVSQNELRKLEMKHELAQIEIAEVTKFNKAQIYHCRKRSSINQPKCPKRSSRN